MKRLVDDLAADPTEANMRNLVAGVASQGATDEEVAYLGMALGTSGTVLTSAPENRSADLASTGGPASLSTILGPIYLRALGYTVPKVGVPGRPAGGVDALSRIPGYRVDMSSGHLANCLDTCGYVHFVAGPNHAPLDARLFEYRRKSGSPPAAELAIASLIAKKVAVGVELAGLDGPSSCTRQSWVDVGSGAT